MDGLERLSETEAFVAMMAGLFEIAGWTLHPPRPALAGGELWIATRDLGDDELEVKRAGARFGDVAAELLQEALKYGPRRLGNIQLQLPIAA